MTASDGLKRQIVRQVLLLWANRAGTGASDDLFALGAIADYAVEVWEQGFATGQHETAQQWINGIRENMADVDDAKALIATVVGE